MTWNKPSRRVREQVLARNERKLYESRRPQGQAVFLCSSFNLETAHLQTPIRGI